MPSRTDELCRDPQFVADILGQESSRIVAKRWDVSKTLVNDLRKKDGFALKNKPLIPSAGGRYRFDEDGTTLNLQTRATAIPQTIADVYANLREEGIDPDDYDLTIKRSKWENGAEEEDGTLRVLHSCSVTGRKKPRAVTATIDWNAAARFVEGFTYIPAKRDFLVDSAILQPTDEQWGKTDLDGGTPEAEVRVMNSYSAFCDYIREYRPRQVLLARTGDAIENYCNTGSQRDTNDLDLPHMLVQSFKMDLQSLKMIAPLVQEVKDARVPSNHGRWRTGLKADAGNPHADFGISVGRQIEDTQRILGVLPNVELLFPDRLMESMTVELDTIRIGLVHGHQASGPDKMGDWWSTQDHGRMPTWDADMLFVGHWHSLRIYQSGDGRWVIVGPTSDNGSSWFSNLKGEKSRSGMLAMCVEGKRWRFQEIL